MPAADYSSYHQPNSTGADGTKFDNFIDAVQATVNGLDKNNLAANAGILASQIADPTVGKVLGSAGSACAAVLPPGFTWDYKELVVDVGSITATTEGTAATVFASNSVTYDGAAVDIDVYVPAMVVSGALSWTVVLLEDSTVLGQIQTGNQTNNPGPGFFAPRRRTPSAGAHVYTVKAFVSAGTLTVKAGSGASGTYAPASIRVTKA